MTARADAAGPVDAVVVGGGIAGVSSLYHLARRGLRAVLVEREPDLGAHSTGRSAATLVPGYGGAISDGLTRAGLPFLLSDADGLAHQRLLTPRSLLWVHPGEPDGPVGDLPGATAIGVDEAVALCPPLRPGSISRAGLQQGGYDIDVEELLQAFGRGARRHGAMIHRSSTAIRLERRADHWQVYTSGFTVGAATVVNAAGAWADDVATAAGLRPAGLRSLKRTAFVTPVAVDTTGLPLVLAADNTFYFKPDVPGVLLCSRADETPSEPGDPRAEEIDVAYAIDRINAHTTLGIRTVHRTWAGLRVFTADREPLIGVHPDDPTFIWCAGLGGTGVQTAPAAGERVADIAAASVALR